jgi:hypothetical protein
LTPSSQPGSAARQDAFRKNEEDADDEGETNELARLRAQLRQTEKECALWRARAERAERRVLVLERAGVRPESISTSTSGLSRVA